MMTETLAVGVFVLLTWLGLTRIGVVATGVAFVGMYAVYLPVVYWLAHRKTEFRWAPAVKRQIGWLMLAAMAVLGAAQYTKMAGALAGLISCAGFGIYGFGRLAHKANLTGPVGRLAAVGRQKMIKIGVWRD